jgi:CubicO group peptidase (beta-lactamase class C family)
MTNRSIFIVTLLLVILLSVTPSSSQTGVYVPELEVFDAKMNGILSKYSLAGGQLAITYQGRLVYSRGFGYADTTDKSLVQPKSIFRLASVSKSITSIAIMKLYEQGLLNLDDTVLGKAGILNDSQFLHAIDPRMYQFTVRQLLDHSSGLSFDFATDPLYKTYDIAIAMGVPPPTYSFPIVLQWTMMNHYLAFSPGTSASYSNDGYILLGLVIEKITGMKYEEYIKSILLPIGITDIHAGRSLQEDKYPNEVSYYDYAGAPLSRSFVTGIPASVPAQYGGYNWEIMTPAGGWVASAEDMCRLLLAVDTYTNKPDILKPQTIATMTMRSVNWPDYGLGWFITADEIYHTGGIQGTASIIRSNKDKQLTYAIIFNALPQNYTPLYNEFMSLVSDEYPNITSWPTHDLFEPPSVTSGFNSKNEIEVFPNPAKNYITISNMPDSYSGSITVANIAGQQVLYQLTSRSDIMVNTESLPVGMYSVVIHSNVDPGVITRKFIKY